MLVMSQSIEAKIKQETPKERKLLMKQVNIKHDKSGVVHRFNDTGKSYGYIRSLCGIIWATANRHYEKAVGTSTSKSVTCKTCLRAIESQ